MRHIRRLQADQAGNVLILYAILMTTLLGIAALVIDLSQVRTDRRLDKSVADSAVRAGLGILQAGPWVGICRAANYLLADSPAFSAYDPGSTQFLQLGLTPVTSSPCLAPLTVPYTTLCLPGGALGNTTWGRFTATALNGRFSIEIDSGYWMPDPRFPEDQVASTDNGTLLMGGCDNLAVIITEKHSTFFGGIFGSAPVTTTIRSVGRLSVLTDGQFNPAVLLLEPHGCSVLSVSGSNTRVIAQPFLDHPGVIQVDSADDQGGCTSNQALLNGQSTSAGPSIVACSATTGISPAPPITPGCSAGTANNPSRIGIYALNWAHPAGDYVTSPYPSTYGDTQAVRSAQSGRGPVDATYRTTVQALDTDAKSVITGNGAGAPPGCSAVVNNACTDASSRTWLVLQPADCTSITNPLSAFVLTHPLWAASQNIYFNCDLTVGAPLTLSGLSSFIVITGKLAITSTFTIVDPRKVYVGGTASGGQPKGIDLQNGSNFNLDNPVPGTLCPPSALIQKYTTLVVGKGSLNMTSGAQAHMCQTFTYLANGYGTVPATNATGPCTCTGVTYTGTVSVGSGSVLDWTAPNLISGRRPTATELATITPFEDLALWTEAGGNNTNSINGGGGGQMTGVFFLPNANSFTLSGGGSANVYLSAQFISRTMSVTGGSVVNLTLNPFDSVPFVIYQLTLVR